MIFILKRIHTLRAILIYKYKYKYIYIYTYIYIYISIWVNFGTVFVGGSSLNIP